MTAPAREDTAGGRGVAVMCLGMLLFSIVDVLNKSLADLPVVQIIWVRFLVFMPIAAAMAWRPRRGIAWRSSRPGMQLLRSAVLVVEMAMFVWAVKLLPLADVQAISASAPLLVTALAVPLLGERVGWRRWCAVGAAFVGVMVIVRPGFQEFDAAMLVALAGTLLWAVYQLMLRLVGREDGAATTALWSAVVGAALTITMQVGYLSPPFGRAAFYLKSVTPPHISLDHIFNSLWPFIALQVVGLAVVLFVPDVAMWLPRMLR